MNDRALLVVVEADDELGEDLDQAAGRLVAGGQHLVRQLIPALRSMGYPRRRGTLAAAANRALTAAGIAVRRGRPVRVQPGV